MWVLYPPVSACLYGIFMQRGGGGRAAAFKMNEEIFCLLNRWYDLKMSLLKANYNFHS